MRDHAPRILTVLFAAALAIGQAPCAEAQFVTPQVIFETPGGDAVVNVEVARTVSEQSRGLMLRTELKPDAGMIFIYDRDADHSFWMKNTYLPLDMIFVGSDGVVVGAVENAAPLTTTSRRIGKPSRHVVEVNAGFCRTHGIQAGTRVRYLGIPELAK
ncbi:MAG: DUF192 domain-containing protein [Deltaproteobacteria bacterium]|nr:DUF192 domain-containing protein [Deltaproteobacteria bacterium]